MPPICIWLSHAVLWWRKRFWKLAQEPMCPCTQIWWSVRSKQVAGVSLPTVKDFSCMMNVRAFKILDMHGTKWQFGGTPKQGCANGLFTLKTLLNMRKNHNLQTHVCFVKAYDTADHKLNCLLLLFERVPEVTIDQNQGSMTMRNIGSRSFDACLNQLKKSLQDQPMKDGIKLL